MAVTKTGLVGQLAAAGFSFPFDVSKILDDAIRNGGQDPFSYAYAKIIQSQPFRHYYVGIFRHDGTLRMTPAEWQRNADAYTATAQKQGFAIDRGRIGNLISGEVSADEFASRVSMAARAKANPDFIKSFNEVAQQTHLHGHQIKTAQDVFNVLSGEKPAYLYDLYEAASFDQAAKGAGLSLGPDSPHRAISLAQSTVGTMNFEDIEKSYAKIANQLRTASTELSQFGLTQKDLETIEFGGSNRAALADQAQRALRQFQANVGAEIGAQGLTANEQGAPILATGIREARQ